MKKIFFFISLIISNFVYTQDSSITLSLRDNQLINSEVFIANIPGIIKSRDEKGESIGLVGSAVTEETDHGTRMMISWHSLTLDGEHHHRIKKKLESKIFVIDSDKITVEDEFKARGDIAHLYMDIGQLASSKGIETVRTPVNSSDNQLAHLTTNDHRKNKPMFPQREYRALSYEGEDKNITDSEKEASIPDLKAYESIESCVPRYDFDQAIKYHQSRTVKKNAKGKILGKSECLDTGEIKKLKVEQIQCDQFRNGDRTHLSYRRHVYGEKNEILNTGECIESSNPIEIEKDFKSGCSDYLVIKDKKIYKRYTEFFMKNDERVDLERCKKGPESTAFDLSYTPEDCRVRHDFYNERSIQQIRWYRLLQEGQRDYVTSCIDTDDPKLVFDHFSTTDGCDIDEKNGLVKVYQQAAYYDMKGKLRTTNTCAPKIGARRPVHEEACQEGEYTHDFVNGYTRRNIRHFFIDRGRKEYLAPCQQEAKNYPHMQDPTGCPIEKDRRMHKKFQLTKTVFKNSLGEEEVIQSQCARRLEGIPYITSLPAQDASIYSREYGKKIKFKGIQISSKETAIGTPVTFHVSGWANFSGVEHGWNSSQFYNVSIYFRTRSDHGWQLMVKLSNQSNAKRGERVSFNTKTRRILQENDLVEFAAKNSNPGRPWSARINVRAEWD